MIQIQNLTKMFANFAAVTDLSLEVGAGEILGFLGPNGAGKSTTMKMVTGFLTPTSGTVSICGYDIGKQRIAAQRLIGYLPEGAPAYNDMTTNHYLHFIAQIRGYDKAMANARVGQIIEQLELESVRYRTIDTLSKGFKRRIGLAQALIHDPTVLILDEPTDGLDPNQKHQVRALIKNLSEEKIVIISTHILEEVSAVCTRAAIIANGKLVVDETPTELARRSRYHGAVTLTIPTSEAYDALHALPGVHSIEQQGFRYTVVPEPGSLISSKINTLIEEKGWKPEELHSEQGHLDEVFRNLTINAGATQ